MTTVRLEAFSDGMFAVPATLLVFKIATPVARHGTHLGVSPVQRQNFSWGFRAIGSGASV